MADRDGASLDAEIWGSLPPDLLENVLSRLPLASILRFRSVSRQWNQLPLDASFSKLHSQVRSSPGFSPSSVYFFKSHINIPGEAVDVTCLEGSSEWRTLPLNFLPSLRLNLEASGGGLLLFSEYNRSTHGSKRLVEAFYVCNPITKASRKLEKSAVRIVNCACIDVDQMTQEFKVVVTGWTVYPYVQSKDDGPLIEVFDSRRNCWELKGSVWKDDASKLYGLALLRGTLYLAIDLGSSFETFNLKVVALHMEEESRELVAGLQEWSQFYCLGEYRGNLVILGQIRGRTGTIEVWQLKKDENRDHRWIVLDSLSKTKIKHSFPVKAAVAGGMVCFYNHFAEALALHELQEQSWRSLNAHSDRQWDWHWIDIPPSAFQPSFVPLKLIQ